MHRPHESGGLHARFNGSLDRRRLTSDHRVTQCPTDIGPSDDVNGSGGADDGEWKFAEFGVDIDGDRRYDRGFDVDRDGRRDSWADVVRFYARMYELQLDAAMVGRDDFFVVASSGNAGPHYTSVYNSPINNVADRVGGRFLSVESTNWNNAISTFSSRGGSVAAPGECVRSVEASNGSNYDSAACASGPRT